MLCWDKIVLVAPKTDIFHHQAGEKYCSAVRYHHTVPPAKGAGFNVFFLVNCTCHEYVSHRFSLNVLFCRQMGKYPLLRDLVERIVTEHSRKGETKSKVQVDYPDMLHAGGGRGWGRGWDRLL